MKSGSHQSSHPISPKRAKHLERNRIAANKCRERKKREHKQIERRLSDEAEKKDLLLAQLNCLREEVWDLKNIIFQHAECEDHQINLQLAKMTQTVLDCQPDLNTGSSPTFSSGTWSDESVADETNIIGPGANTGSDWTVLPKAANDLVPYEPTGFTESLFENYIADNLYP
ncbi:transcriptional regulator family: bZIP [Penicillium paradoxum]|uniref:transcriptional regulator family: bZIP n=1 Tax=Penicillium paradoxum TaxID=176176 RepID=UPI0025490441|nr:transcriptional regulator family: bZIP [Penicillium paradoxum]KAJ5788292.1 transcriptional regulator family: bZIP [Penicillium paradoxum]